MQRTQAGVCGVCAAGAGGAQGPDVAAEDVHAPARVALADEQVGEEAIAAAQVHEALLARQSLRRAAGVGGRQALALRRPHAEQVPEQQVQLEWTHSALPAPRALTPSTQERAAHTVHADASHIHPGIPTTAQLRARWAPLAPSG